MATNQFFALFQSAEEQALTDELTIEVIQIHGYDVYYLPREIVNEDYFYTEDRFSRFMENFPIEAYLENVDNFGGDGDFLSKFGIEMRDQATFVVSQTRFKQAVPDLPHPREGDLIYFPLSGGLFEIMFVEHENPFFQHGKQFCYKFTCELFSYSQEEISTGIEEIDRLEDRLENVNDTSNDRFAENDNLQTEANTLIDFDERNPFGDI